MKFVLTTLSFENHQQRLLLTAWAGKGAARGREEDSLLIKVWPSEVVSLSDEALDQALLVTPYDPALEEQVTAGRDFMRDFRDTFHALAK